ncbi:MAG: response regulator transcription factor [Eubacteriales bacterium]
MKKIRVIIADDQNLICEGIQIILNSQPDIEVIAAANNGLQTVELVSTLLPDVVLMDIEMPVMNGIEALKEIKEKYPKTIVLMLTTFDPDNYIISAFKNGADGYLLKDTSGEKLANTIREALSGNIIIPAAIAGRIIAQIPKENQFKRRTEFTLTQRESEVAELMAKGYSNVKISQTLGISMGSVKNYISTIYSKLQTSNRQEAILVIIEKKIRAV